MPIYKVDGEKKNGLQKYRVIVNYTDSNGNYKKIERTAYGNEEAKELERKLSNKKLEPTKSITVQQLYDDYILYKKIEVRESSLNKTKQILSNHVLPTFANIKLKNINLENLKNWKILIESKKLALTMRQNIYGEFRALLNYAIKFELLQENPLKKIGNFKDAYMTKKNIDFYTDKEFLKYIASAKRLCSENSNSFYELNFYVFFCIAFYTGLRKGEIHALKWSDIDGNVLHVRRSITQKLKGGDRETPPKNKASYRSLQIPKPLMKILKEHYKRYKNVLNFSDDWRVCGGLRPLRDSTIDNRNVKFSKDAGIKKIRIHDFRHSHVSVLANYGINIQEIARRLGHSNVEVTWNTYSHLYPKEEERAVSILNKVA